MKHRKAIITIFCLLVSATGIAAQTSRPGSRATTATAKPKADTQPEPGTLAIVNGQAITLADLDPKLREMIEGLDKEIANQRRSAIESEVNNLLFEAEAKRRKVTVEQLLDAEVASRVPNLTEQEVVDIYSANRDQFGGADLATVRPQIIAYVRQQRTQAAANEFAMRLRMMHLVEMGADVNAPNLAPTAVLATVAGRTVTAGAFNEQIRQDVYEVRMRVYEAEKQAVDEKINNLLVLAEAKRRDIQPEELLRAEVSDKVRPPTDADVVKFYEQNKGQIEGDLASRRSDIASFLEQQEWNRLRQALDQRLRGGANLRLFLTEPEAPIQSISIDDDPSRGDVKAPVTVVVFTDFQCPACGGTHPVLDQVIASYGNSVRLVIRDFPLGGHTFARKAAEAAAAAAAQGKYFEYINILFKNQSALDIPSLKKYATQLGLDRARFDAELDGGTYAAEVSKDVADGQAYGVTSTPTIFVNGVRIRATGLNEQGIKEAIDRALRKAGQK